MCDDDFANAVHYFSLLTKEMAEKVMDAVLSIFECGAGDPEAQIPLQSQRESLCNVISVNCNIFLITSSGQELTHSNVQNHSERTGDECESKMNVAAAWVKGVFLNLIKAVGAHRAWIRIEFERQ